MRNKFLAASIGFIQLTAFNAAKADYRCVPDRDNPSPQVIAFVHQQRIGYKAKLVFPNSKELPLFCNAKPRPSPQFLMVDCSDVNSNGDGLSLRLMVKKATGGAAAFVYKYTNSTPDLQEILFDCDKIGFFDFPGVRSR